MKGKENSKILKLRKRPFKIHWTEEEDRVLFSMAELNKRKSWKSISKMLNNKTPSQCFYRFHAKNSVIIKKNWSKDEDRKINEFIKAYGRKWDELAKILGSRTPKQIKERFLNKLDENLVRSKFASEEDERIISLYLKYGSKWSFISRFFSGRTPDMIKSRFYSSLQKRILCGIEDNNNLDNDNDKVDAELNQDKESLESQKSSSEEEKQEKKKKKKPSKQRSHFHPKKKQINQINQNQNSNTDFILKNIHIEENNNTLTDISFYEYSEKDFNSNSNSLTNSNSNPFNNIAVPQQKDDFNEKSFIEFLSEDEILKQNEIANELKYAEIIYDNNAYNNVNNNYSNNNSNYNHNNIYSINNDYNSSYGNNFYCDLRNNLNFYSNENQFEFISYIQKQFQENIFEAMND